MAGKHSRTIVKGCHRKPAVPKRVASRAGSAAFATAAAGAIAVTAVGGHHTSLPSVSLTADVSITSPQVVHTVTVRPGDSLSSIAARDCGTAADWTGLYEKNKGVIGGDPNRIRKGLTLALDCEARLVYVTTTAAYDRNTPVSTSGMGWFQSCVIRAESGGNADIWNSTGHWGLYQFSAATWAAHGGDPALFGHASAAYQTQIFWNTVHEDGTSDWAPYDGCL